MVVFTLLLATGRFVLLVFFVSEKTVTASSVGGAQTRRFSSGAIALIGLGVVLLAVGAKLALVQHYGTDQPFADQWAAEGMYFLRGPLYYRIDLAQLASFHGEHRPALMRLWVRGLILANGGQWDCFVELVANLLIYAGFLAVLWRYLVSQLEGLWLGLAAAFMAVLFALPCAYENFLWGFQSHFFFLLLLGTLHVGGTLAQTRLGIRWWLAQVAGFLGLFSIAAGAMSAAVLVVLAAISLLRGGNRIWAGATLVVNAALFGFGFWLLPEAMVPEGGRLARAIQALIGTGHLLSWPFSGWAWCLLLQAPWIIWLIGSWWKRDGGVSASDRIAGALGLWVAGIAFAIAFGRVVTSENIGVRYYDVLVLGLFVSFCALIRISARLARSRRFVGLALTAAWLIPVSRELWLNNRPQNLAPMFAYQHDLAVEQRQIIREFLVSNDPARLQAFEQESHRFPHFQITLDFLRDPKVSALLPPSLTPDGHENRLSRMARRIAGGWSAVIALGAALAAVGTMALARTAPVGDEISE